jgi:eukaryotic-like serine/threonine-protein kinase
MTASVFADALRDRYRLERELGRGGMATVYLAHDLKHDREVALKVLHPELAAALGPERFQREIHTTARLQHPHILPVLDSGEAVGRVWYTMPYVSGESLRARLTREGQLPLDVAVELTRQAALALAYAHRQGVVHRDLKPENILLSEGQALVADFGVAKALAGTDQGALTETGMAVGTPAYMSPEQATGGSIDGRTDIYALGCVLYEMLAGEPPFSGPTHQAILAKRMLEPVPHVRTLRDTVPEALDQAVARSLAKAPADRFATADELGRALQESAPNSASTVAASVARPTQTVAAPLLGPRRRVPVVGMALIVGFLIGLGVLFAWRRSRGASGAAEGSRVIAVLPFESVGDSADAYFADGVTDEVRTKLAQIASLEVIARGSSAEYRGTAKPPTQIAHELGADYLLTATVRWNKAAGQPSRVRVTAELVDASSGRTPRTRWGQNFDAAISDVFQVQADIASQVAGALDVVLGDSARRSLAERPTENVDAYDAYLRGNEKVKGDYSPSALHAAEEEFQRAVQLDSSFAAAWAALGHTHLGLFRLGGSQVRDLERAKLEIARAAALAPDLPSVRLVDGELLEYQGDPEGALRVYEAGLRVTPNDVEFLGHAAVVKADLGRHDAALADLERASRLDPRSPTLALARYRTYLYLRRYDEAQAAMDEARSLTPVGVSLIHEQAWLRAMMGDLPGARRALASAYEVADSTAVVAYVALREDLMWLLDDSEQRRLLALTPADLDGGRADWALALAETYYRRGDKAKARAYGDSAYAAYVPLLPHSLSQGDRAQYLALQALALACEGHTRTAVAKGEEALRAAGTVDAGQRSYIQSLLVRVLIMGGQNERALDLLESLVRERKSRTSPGFLRINGDYDPLRGNPRFERLASGS